MTEATWLLLDRYGIIVGDLMLSASIIAAFVGFLRRNDLKRWLKRNSFGQVGKPVAEGERYDALLLPISKPEVPCWLIDTLRPARIALIATPQSQDAAAQVETHARAQGVTVTARLIPLTTPAK